MNNFFNKKLNTKVLISLGVILFLTSLLFLPIIQKLIINCFELILGRQLSESHWSGYLFNLAIRLFIIELVISFIYVLSDDIKNKYIYNYSNVFIFLVLVCFLLSNYRIIKNHSFEGYCNSWNWGDLTHCIESYNNTSLYGSNYPPIAVLIYKFFFLFLPSDSVDKAYAINYLLNVYMMVTTLSIFILTSLYISVSQKKKIIFGLIIFLTGPVLFAYQRMNLIILSFIFTFFFLVFYNSKNRVLREISFISLAIAANIKFFPAIFGALLLKEKKWKQALRCVIYGVFLFFIPMLFSYNQVSSSVTSNVSNLIGGVKSFSENSDVLTGLSISVISYRLGNTFHLNFLLNPIIRNISTILCLSISLFSFFICKKRYQSILILSFLCIFVPISSAWYGLIFLIPSLFIFLTEEKISVYNTIVFILLSSIFIFMGGFNKYFDPNAYWHLLLLWLISITNIIYKFLSLFTVKK